MDQRKKMTDQFVLKLHYGNFIYDRCHYFQLSLFSNAVNSYYDQKMMEKNLAEMAQQIPKNKQKGTKKWPKKIKS